MKALHRKRLEKLATHLEKGKLGHDKFDFSALHDVTSCGTAGCALGECPTVFPRQWKLSGSYHPDPRLRRTRKAPGDSFCDAEYFFGLTGSEAMHLFHPNEQNTDAFGGKHLGESATRRQVASNIRAFIKKMEKTKP
jgi:hypothetical protein